jgi:hypothetical protein
MFCNLKLAAFVFLVTKSVALFQLDGRNQEDWWATILQGKAAGYNER